MQPTAETRELKKVRAELARLCGAMREMERRHERDVRAAHPRHRASARNLLHYLALRQRDLRPLQQSLSELGLSSLGRGEPGALGSVETVLRTVERLLGREGGGPARVVRGLSPEEGRRILERHTRALLGPPSPGRRVRIMVTMPGDAATEPPLLRGLLARGMNVMRINCAHEEPEVWAGMIRNLRRVKGGKGCRIFMDLSGPKPRTGTIAPGPAVISWRPKRDPFGRVAEKARVLLVGDTGSGLAKLPGASAVIPVDPAWLARRRGGETVRFRDTGQSRRTLRVIRRAREGLWCESGRTTYVVPGTTFTVVGRDGLRDRTSVREFLVEQRIPLKKRERILVTRDGSPGEPALTAGRERRIAHIGVTFAGMLDRVRTGDPVWFDDGKIGGVVRRQTQEGLEVEITSTRERGRKLGSGKSINLPGTPPSPIAFAPTDAAALAFAARHADMVGLSFVRRASDIRLLQSKLSSRGAAAVGLVVKIENRSAFEHLPELLLAAMRSPVVGILIARGDLAVECGYERLAEIQEETLWFCEAAHLPVFWATQVLEKLAQSGMPSRAEITDAAAAERAECVMLNKGPHIFAAMETLDGILRRMQSHATKKRPHLRPLAIAKRIT